MALLPINRIIILVDMDCFYCQVEEGLNPKLKGKPIAVVQYNQWQGGGIIAVNYPARDHGVTRHMRGGEAKEKCPALELVSVPTKRGKADTSRYRVAGKRVAEVLLTFAASLERASVDEAYLDVTEHVHDRINTASARLSHNQLQNTHVVGFDSIQNFLEEVYDNELSNDEMLRLAIGAVMAEEIRAAVFEKTGYRCSAGIAHNKILAKLVCGLHKPNQQTVLPQDGVTELYERMPVRKIQSMGGKFGTNVTDSLNIEYMGGLTKFSEKELRQHFDDKTSHWLYQLARGIEHTPVTVRLRSQSIGCCKKFPGPTALTCMTELRPWLDDLVAELHERLAEDRAECGRRARHLVVSVSYVPPDVLKVRRKLTRKDEVAQSRSVGMVADWDTGDGIRTSEEFLSILKKSGVLPSNIEDDESKVFSIRFLGLSAGKFQDITNQASISSFFTTALSDNNKCPEKSAVSEKPLEKDTVLQENSNADFNLEVDKNVASTIEKKHVVLSNRNTLQNKNTSKQICAKSNKNNLKKIGHMPIDSFFINYLRNVEQESHEDSTNANLKTKTNPTKIIIEQDLILGEEKSCQQNDESSQTICSECNKPINLDEVQSHSDYHFAIKLVKEEAHTYKNVTPKQYPTQSKKTAVKRKIYEPVNCKSIVTFFTRENDLLDGKSLKKCDECGMLISESNFEMHKDFHVAKKLSNEINGGIKSINSTRKENNEKEKYVSPRNQNKRLKCDTYNISTYFKPK